jgi:hypothetical protein
MPGATAKRSGTRPQAKSTPRANSRTGSRRSESRPESEGDTETMTGGEMGALDMGMTDESNT